jgi:hypothetical protein
MVGGIYVWLLYQIVRKRRWIFTACAIVKENTERKENEVDRGGKVFFFKCVSGKGV